MLKPKEELAKTLSSACARVMFDGDKVNTITETMLDKYNIPTGITMDMLAGRADLKEQNEFLLFALTEILDKNTNKHRTEKYFTEAEQKEYSVSKYKKKKIKFPIEIRCLQVASDQWIGVTDSNFLMKLREAQLINYNINAQRTLQRIVRGEKSYYKIAVNTSAVNQIADSMKKGEYIPNTITLNIPEDAIYNYDSNKGIMSISSINHFDISDGYHRYLGMCKDKDADPDFNYPMELRLVLFPEQKSRQFIYQEDQKTKMRKIDSESMNMNAPENIVIERLNSDMLFNFKGVILRNGGKINYSHFASIIKYFFFSGRKPDKTMQRILKVKNLIRDGFNVISEKNSEFLNKNFDFIDLMIIGYELSKLDIDNYSEQIQEMADKILILLNKKDKLDKRTFISQVPRKAMVTAIDNLEAE